MVFTSKNISLLIIEDNLGDFVLIETYLIENIKNPIIIRAVNFQQSKDILNSKTDFDVIFLDLSLPDESGEKLVTEIIKLARSTPVIALTGYADKDFIVKILSLGVSDYLLKDELNASLLQKSIVFNIERKRVNNELNESEKKYRSLFDLSPIPMWVIDPESLIILNANVSATQNYGYSNAEFLKMKLEDIKEVEKLKTSKNNFSNTITTHIKKNGDLIHVELQSSNIGFNNKNAWLVMAVDVTEKINAQQALIESAHYFKALVQDGADLISILDVSGNYKYVSPSSKNIIGIESKKLLNKNVFDFIHKDDKKRVLSQFSFLSEKKTIRIYH